MSDSIVGKCRKTLENRLISGFQTVPLNQVHDAEVVLVSKSDLLTDAQVSEVVAQVRREAPEDEVLPYSAVTLETWRRWYPSSCPLGPVVKPPRPDDPAIFAMEKASMGWYNLSGTLGAERLDLSAFITTLMRWVAEAFHAQMTGHVKVIISSPKAAVKMSLVEGNIQVEGLKGGRYMEGEGKLVINARVSVSPDELKRAFDSVVSSACSKFQASLKDHHEACFSPKLDAPDHLLR